MIQKIIVDVWK